ncbi:MAG: major capsid protein [Gallionellaceae bacterium]|nr:major capsid protein [Gallionellaceae bacterium]
MNKKLVATVVLSSPLSAFAALDPAIQTQATIVAADAATLGGIVLLLIVGIALFTHLRKAK